MSAPIPTGIEVLVKKASVDAEFKTLLLDRRAAAADAIGLKLEAAEAMMLAAVPAEQLEAIIARTSVPQEHRRTFLGQAAAAMVAALSTVTPVAAMMPAPGGHPVERPKPQATEYIEQKIVAIVARQLGLKTTQVKRESLLVKDLKASQEQLEAIKKEIEKFFTIEIPKKAFQSLDTVGSLIECVVRKVRDTKDSTPGGLREASGRIGQSRQQVRIQRGKNHERPDSDRD